MLGGGAGHIADMIARMKANKALQQRRRTKRDKQGTSNNTSSAEPLKFKTISKNKLAHFKQSLRKKRRLETIAFVVFFVIVLGVIFYFFCG